MRSKARTIKPYHDNGDNKNELSDLTGNLNPLTKSFSPFKLIVPLNCLHSVLGSDSLQSSENWRKYGFVLEKLEFQGLLTSMILGRAWDCFAINHRTFLSEDKGYWIISLLTTCLLTLVWSTESSSFFPWYWLPSVVERIIFKWKTVTRFSKAWEAETQPLVTPQTRPIYSMWRLCLLFQNRTAFTSETTNIQNS